MSVPEHLRKSDFSAVYRLVDECLCLGADAHSWQMHMLGGLTRITGCQIATVGETVPTANGLVSDLRTAIDVGWGQDEKRRAMAYLTSGEFPHDEFCLCLAQTFLSSGSDEMTRSRRQLIDDRAWSASETAEAYRQLGTGDSLMSLARLPGGKDRAFCVTLSHAFGRGVLKQREVGIAELLCRFIRPHLGGGLALIGEPGISELSRRRRQVLAGLLDGLAEKQIAAQLGLSLPTVHEYVTALYRHFHVGSRGELLALFLRRSNGPATDWVKQFDERTR